LKCTANAHFFLTRAVMDQPHRNQCGKLQALKNFNNTS